MEKVNKTINKLLSNNVAIKFYMLGSLMKSGSLGNVNSRIVVTKGSVRRGNTKCKSWKRYWIHCSSHAKDAKAWYSASEEDREIVVCFLNFQATKDVPKKTQYPEIEHRVVAHVTQLESENVWILKEVLDLYKSPYPQAFFK